MCKKVQKNHKTNNKNNQYHNGKPNPDDVVLQLYTTYDPNSFNTLSITSCPMILVHNRELCRWDIFELSVVVKLQIIIFPVENKLKLPQTKYSI